MSNPGCPFRNPMDCPFYKSNELSHTHTGLHVTGLAADAAPLTASRHPLGSGLEENYRLKQEVERLKHALQQSNSRLEKLETQRSSPKRPAMPPSAMLEWEAAARTALSQTEADVRDKVAVHFRSLAKFIHTRNRSGKTEEARLAELQATERRLAERGIALEDRERRLVQAEAAAAEARLSATSTHSCAEAALTDAAAKVAASEAREQRLVAESRAAVDAAETRLQAVLDRLRAIEAAARDRLRDAEASAAERESNLLRLHAQEVEQLREQLRGTETQTTEASRALEEVLQDMARLRDLKSSMEEERAAMLADVQRVRAIEAELERQRGEVVADIAQLRQLKRTVSTTEQREQELLKDVDALKNMKRRMTATQENIAQREGELAAGWQAIHVERRRLLEMLTTMEQQQDALEATRKGQEDHNSNVVVDMNAHEAGRRALQAAWEAFQQEKRHWEMERDAMQGEGCPNCASFRADAQQLQAMLEEVDRMVEERTWMLREETQALIQATEDAMRQRERALDEEALRLEKLRSGMLDDQRRVVEDQEEMARVRGALLQSDAHRLLRQPLPPAPSPGDHFKLPAPARLKQLAPLPHTPPAIDPADLFRCKEVVVLLGHITDLKATFHYADTDGTGLLDGPKLHTYCLARGMTGLTPGHIAAMIQEVDYTGSGGVDLWGFFAIQLYIGLQLEAKGVHLQSWLRFVTQSDVRRRPLPANSPANRAALATSYPPNSASAPDSVVGAPRRTLSNNPPVSVRQAWGTGPASLKSSWAKP